MDLDGLKVQAKIHTKNGLSGRGHFITFSVVHPTIAHYLGFVWTLNQKLAKVKTEGIGTYALGGFAVFHHKQFAAMPFPFPSAVWRKQIRSAGAQARTAENFAHPPSRTLMRRFRESGLLTLTACKQNKTNFGWLCTFDVQNGIKLMKWGFKANNFFLTCKNYWCVGLLDFLWKNCPKVPKITSKSFVLMGIS